MRKRPSFLWKATLPQSAGARKKTSHGMNYMMVALAAALVMWSLSLLVNSCNLAVTPLVLHPSFSFLSPPDATPTHPAASHTSPTVTLPYRPPTGLARAWRPLAFPCYPQDGKRLMYTTPTRRGLLFLRPHKVGSTTMVGIVLRLVHHRSSLPGRPCHHRAMHGSAQSYVYAQRDRSESFLFSLVRDPTKRAISQFFHFAVSAQGGQVPTDATFQEYLRHADRQNYYLKDLATRNYTANDTVDELEEIFYQQAGNLTVDGYNQIMDVGGEKAALLELEWDEMLHFGPRVKQRDVVSDILTDYDFLAVTERLDESLVALQMLLNLTTREILYTRARSSGTFSYGGPKRPCLYMQPSFVTPGMRDFFASVEWQKAIAGDQLLYEAANESLDRTIASLGSHSFARKLQVYRAVLVKAQVHCQGRVHTLCTEGGVHQTNTSCYIWGEGCDHECLGDLVHD
jgi:hypothetical protein